ncbi:MAG: hypothetical protein KDK35_21475 [Leptospiraceae bacterium]|nr:hypothetical protein [Leptospiraceae bacterium]MCP5485997.1 hypothetical protein [Spirochaetales bacterium]
MRGLTTVDGAGEANNGGSAHAHVEGHTAALMRQRGLQEGTLYINRVPCSGVRARGEKAHEIQKANQETQDCPAYGGGTAA